MWKLGSWILLEFREKTNTVVTVRNSFILSTTYGTAHTGNPVLASNQLSQTSFQRKVGNRPVFWSHLSHWYSEQLNSLTSDKFGEVVPYCSPSTSPHSKHFSPSDTSVRSSVQDMVCSRFVTRTWAFLRVNSLSGIIRHMYTVAPNLCDS